jgi:hypothetical protein
LIRTLAAAALLGGAACAFGQPAATKAELVARVLQLQRAGIEAIARSLAERPAIQITQEAGQIARTQVAADKRAALGKRIEASVRRYVDEATPIVRQHAQRLAPGTLGAGLQQKFSDDELRELIAWLDSPLNRKYTQVAPDLQNEFVRKLLAEAAPAIEPKLQALSQEVRAMLVDATAEAASAPRAAAAPARAASR